MVTEQKCSRCHDLERIRLAHHELVDWPMYVEKITQGDTRTIVRCLDYMKTLQRQQA